MRAVVCLMLMVASLPAVAAVDVYAVRPTEKITATASPTSGWASGKIELQCARNEGESIQIVLRSPETLPEVSLQVTLDLRKPGAPLPAEEPVRLHKVEWVDINAPYEVDQPSTNPNFQPDPLPPVHAADRYTLEPNRNLVFWLNLRAPRDAGPGVHRGGVTVLSAGRPVGSLDLLVQVHDFELPRRPRLQSMIGFSDGNIYKAHGCKTTEDKEKIIRMYFDEYIRARLSPFLYAPGTMAFNPIPNGRIGWEFARDAEGKLTGEATLDFAVFDREAQRYFDEQDVFSAFNFAPYLWTRDAQKQMVLVFRDAKGAAIERRNADGSINPIFDKLVINVFGGIARHLAEKGWLDRAIYYVTDEPRDDDTPYIKEICELIRQADPRIRTSLTYDPSNRPRLAELVDAQGKSLISVWIPYVTHYREEVAREQRKRGADYWLYDVSTTCLIGHSGLTNRSIMWDVWRRNAHGYLYYLSTWWGREVTPWDRPSFLLPEFTYRYRQGDGYFFYPPQRTYNPEQPIFEIVPTIRWEMLREGAEDYEVLRMAEELTAKAEGRVAAQGKAALARAAELADYISGAVSAYGIRDLKFEVTDGWTFGLEEGWLRHGGGKRSDLPITIQTELPDGRYELVLNLYEDPDYRGLPYSRFLVDGKPYRTSGSGMKGGENVTAGTVEVKRGKVSFTLSSTDEQAGLILYKVGLRSLPKGEAPDLYQVRAQLGEAIEALQKALRR